MQRPALDDDALAFLTRIGEKNRELPLRLRDMGLDLNIFVPGIVRLIEMERSKLKPGGRQNRRRSLLRTVECLKEAEKCLDHGFPGLSPHWQTLVHVQRSRKEAEFELRNWETVKGRRGPTPETRIIVALLACLCEQTGKLRWKDFSELISKAYRAALLPQRYSTEALKQLWKNHGDRKGDWRALLVRKSSRKLTLGELMKAPPGRLAGALRPRFYL